MDQSHNEKSSTSQQKPKKSQQSKASRTHKSQEMDPNLPQEVDPISLQDFHFVELDLEAAPLIPDLTAPSEHPMFDPSLLSGYYPGTYITPGLSCDDLPLDPFWFPDFDNTPMDFMISQAGPSANSNSSGSSERMESNHFSNGLEYLSSLKAEVHSKGQDLESSNDSGSQFNTPASSQDGVESSARQSQGSASNVPVKSSNGKRTFDDMNQMISCFSTTNEANTSRTKSAYDPSKRKQVALSRAVGSCSRCRFRKVAFESPNGDDPDGQIPRPCKQCLKAARSAELARCLCIHDTFLELRFGGFDILLESFTQDFLRSEIKHYNGPHREIHLELLFDKDSPTAAQLPVIVQDYSTKSLKPGSELENLFHRVAISDTNFEVVPSQRYAIVPESIPTVDDLLHWVQFDMITTEGSTTKRFIVALHGFMSEYCEHDPPLPLRDLLVSSIRILKLLRCWRSGKTVRNSSSSSSPTESHTILASKAVSSQILSVIKTAIRKEELFVLKSVEKLIYSGSGPGSQNVIPLWAVLWSLILTYRDCGAVYRQYSNAPRPDNKQPGFSDHEMVIDASKRMYNALTANYAALFQVSSPLHIDWSLDSNFALIGRSESLRKAFYDLRTEVLCFYHSSADFEVGDGMLKTMVIEYETLLKPRYQSAICV